MKGELTTLLIIVSSAIFSVHDVHGQTTVPSQRRSRPDTVLREQQRQVEMQMVEQALTTEGRAPRIKRYAPAVLDQIRSDFLKIQIADRRLMNANQANVVLGLRLVGELTGEIRTRSRRLKENLALPEPAQQASSSRATVAEEPTNERLKMSLADLSDLIESFVSNPMFEHTRLFDPKLSDKALLDLEAIIRLSDEIKRNSEKLQRLQNK